VYLSYLDVAFESLSTYNTPPSLAMFISYWLEKVESLHFVHEIAPPRIALLFL
jgi:hypothetical protein